MPKEIKRALVLISSIVCIVLGLIGLALPLLQGIFLIALGLALFGLWSPKSRAWLGKQTASYPKVHTLVEKLENWVERVIGNPND